MFFTFWSSLLETSYYDAKIVKNISHIFLKQINLVIFAEICIHKDVEDVIFINFCYDENRIAF